MAAIPQWRKMTWFIVIVNILFLVWVIGGAGSVADSCEGLTGSELDACQAGTAIGASIGIGLILVLWVVVDIILGILWLVTNRGQRDCPVCGKSVKRGQTTCKNCGYDFATGQRPGAAGEAGAT
ncbi:MAG: zinc ribbon domain-containing protein [Actinomycetota bacterium]